MIVKTHAILGMAAAIALPAAAASAQQAPTTVEPLVPAAGTVLDLSAEGKATRTADLATIRAGVVTQAASAGAALADNAGRMNRVVAALKRAGIAPRDVATADVSLSPQYRYTDGQPPVITGYQATNAVSVKFRDVAKAGPILDALVAQGANQIDGPNLSVAEPDAALDEARADALKRAQARANLYAKAAGMRVARIVSINETGQDAGSPSQPVFYARAMAADTRTAIQPGEKAISVTLAVRFLLQ